MEIRRAVPGDETAVAEVHVRSWQAAYRGLLPDACLDALRPADRAARCSFADEGAGAPTTVVAVEHGTTCGFATVGKWRDGTTPRTGELYALYVDPDRWNRGVGRELIGEARRLLVARGSSVAALWVLVGNTRAQRFYRLDGWTSTGETRLADVHGLTVREVRFGRALP